MAKKITREVAKCIVRVSRLGEVLVALEKRMKRDGDEERQRKSSIVYICLLVPYSPRLRMF